MDDQRGRRVRGRKKQRTQRQEWAAHVDAVTAAVTTAKVQKTYRNHLVRFVLFLHNMTCNSSEVDDRSIEGENSDEESEEEGIPKEDFDILHDRLKAAIEAVPFPEITGRKNWLNWRRGGISRSPSSGNSKRPLLCITPLILTVSLHGFFCTIYAS
jgi:hypothetical protein